MPRSLRVLALSATLAATGPAAQETQGVVLRGMGALGCETLVEALEGEQSNDAAARLVAWLAGYVSQANRADPEVADVLPYARTDGLATVVARVCASNRDAQVAAVTASVLATLAPLAVTRAEEAVDLSRGAASRVMRPAVLKGVQDRLIARGLLPEGSADGLYGDRTAEAVARFQEAAGVETTGLPDAWTIFLLQAAQ